MVCERNESRASRLNPDQPEGEGTGRKLRRHARIQQMELREGSVHAPSDPPLEYAWELCYIFKVRAGILPVQTVR
jgi:hypothetical protein